MCLIDGVCCLEQVLRTTFGILSGPFALVVFRVDWSFSIPLVIICRVEFVSLLGKLFLVLICLVK